MMKKAWIATALLLSTTAEAECSDCNVLWIVMDTTRADYVGCFGGDVRNTPNIDRLCESGTSFAHTYSQAPATMLSVSSYMSGRRRLNTGIDFMLWNDEDFHPLSPEVTTLAEVLQAEGFRTIGLTSNPMIGQREEGFDLQFYQGFEVWETIVDRDVRTLGPQWLDELEDEKFFFYVHLMGPHHPNYRRAGFNERRGTDYPEELGHLNQRGLFRDWNLGDVEVDDELFGYIREIYSDNLWQADHHYVSLLLDQLEERGLMESTLIVFSSDHGEALGEEMEFGQRSNMDQRKRYWGHSHFTLVDETLHVPLIFSGPGIESGVQDDESVVELIDIAPTITDYLGIEQQESWGWDGEPVLGPRRVRGTAAISDRGSGNSARSAARTVDSSMTWHHGWETFLAYQLDTTERPAGGDISLYHSAPRVLVDPTAEHELLREILQHYMDTRNPPADTESIEAPEGELLDELRALGYME